MKKESKYQEPKRVKVGRIKYVCDFDGKPLVGLSWDRGNGQYFYTHYKSEKDFIAGRKTRKDYSFGSDYAKAVFAFKQWREQAGKLTLALPQGTEVEQWLTATLTPDDVTDVQEILAEKGVSDYPVDAVHRFKLQAPDLSDYPVESKIKTDRQYALHLLQQLLSDEEIKIEAIRLLKLNDLMPKQHRPLPLAEIASFYREHSSATPKEKTQVESTLAHFKAITGKSLLNDVTEDDVFIYRDAIASLNKSTTYTNGRYERLKRALNYYNNNKQGNGEKEIVRTVLDYCKALKQVTGKVQDAAKTFDVPTLKKIFKAAENDSEMFLMCLLMLNTGYTPVDIRKLRKEQIQEKDGLTYIDFSRTKTGEQFFRINCLWTVTAELLRKHCASHTSPYVFVTGAKGAYKESTLGKRFSAFFEAMPYTAKHFKDTVVSELAFSISNTNILKLTIGHSTASKDQFWKYVRTQPQQQKEAADILWAKFSSALPESLTGASTSPQK
jgi:integrase